MTAGGNEQTLSAAPEPVDIFVIGGGVNGCGIARDAAGRGLSVVLCEMGDLAQATSSASTKLFHGGLRYLEYFQFRLVREALIEREVLYRSMPHISWPMRFVLPVNPDIRFTSDPSSLGKILRLTMPFLGGRRPAWLTRLGLFVYDHLGGRKILPPTETLDLTSSGVGKPLKPGLKRAFEYSDCWVDDARLVVLCARDAANRGAEINTRTRVESARRVGGHWEITVRHAQTGSQSTYRAKALINAAGPWVDEVLNGRIGQNGEARIRLVRGSHVVVRKLFDHDRPYFLQLPDGRIVFAIPYQEDFTLIGTTDHDHDGDPGTVRCSDEERDYLLSAANLYFRRQLTSDDIVWTYSGVRPLYDDNASSATAATRDYVLALDHEAEIAPLLNVYGGKITTFRRLAEEAVDRLKPYFPEAGGHWTSSSVLPGGDFEPSQTGEIIKGIRSDYPFLTPNWARRLVRAYGRDASVMLQGARSSEDLGRDFGATLSQREVDWLIEREWAHSAEDILWRRSKLGLRHSEAEQEALDLYVRGRLEALDDPAPAARPA